MRVAYITTWGQQCGIATYTEELAQALREDGVGPVAFAPAGEGAGIREVPGIPWREVWSRNCAGLSAQLLAHLDGVDVLHFQHEDGLFRDPSGFLAALDDCRKKVKTVVTLHTVRHYGGWESTGFYDDLCKLAHAVVVHTPEALVSLSHAKGRTTTLVRIPHGTPRVAVESSIVNGVEQRTRGVKFLGLPEPLASMIVNREVSLGLAQGFQGPSKNSLASIRGFASAVARRLSTKSAFVISGEAFDQSWWGILQGNIASTGYANRMFYSPQFVSHEQMAYVMAAADWGVLNTNAWVLSSSGAAHLYAAYGVPIACASRPIYYEALQAGAIPFDIRSDDPTMPSESLINVIGALSAHEDVREQVAADMRKWAASTDWAVIGRKHLELYTKLLRARS